MYQSYASCFDTLTLVHPTNLCTYTESSKLFSKASVTEVRSFVDRAVLRLWLVLPKSASTMQWVQKTLQKHLISFVTSYGSVIIEFTIGFYSIFKFFNVFSFVSTFLNRTDDFQSNRMCWTSKLKWDCAPLQPWDFKFNAHLISRITDNSNSAAKPPQAPFVWWILFFDKT